MNMVRNCAIRFWKRSFDYVHVLHEGDICIFLKHKLAKVLFILKNMERVAVKMFLKILDDYHSCVRYRYFHF